MKNIEKEQITSTKFRRIEILFKQGAAGSISDVLAAFIATLLFYNGSQNIFYLYWMASIFFFSGLRFIISRKFLQSKPAKENYPLWCNYYMLITFLIGATWGSLLLIDLTHLSTLNQQATIFLLTFISFVAISIYSSILAAYLIFISSMFSFAAIFILSSQNEIHMIIIIALLILYLTLLSTAKMLNMYLVQYLSKQIEVEKLLSHVENVNQQLEEKVLARTAELIEAKEIAEQANHSKSYFLANITHELRTPLHAILSFSKLGGKKYNSISLTQISDYFTKIELSGERLLQLMDNLLALSKLSAKKVEFDIHKIYLPKVIEECRNHLDILIEEKSLKINLDIDQQRFELMADKLRIEQVINNLLGNAIKFSPNNSEIVIQLKKKDFVTGRRETDTQTQPAIQFSISDEGVGIPKDELEVIFKQFVQSSHTKSGIGGTGLGLAICKEIIEGHNGKIWAENNRQEGATFYFVIPLLEKQGN